MAVSLFDPMIVPGTIAPLRPVFISFSSKDLKLATTICHAIESRGAACWISNRDVKGGENFQEAIITAIQAAKVMVLVFSSNTNNSGEIKKELAIASQNGLVVIPVRIEDVLPSGAFAYELSTRQWVDLFQDWEMAMEGLTGRIASVLGTADVALTQREPEPRHEDLTAKNSIKKDDKDKPQPSRMPFIGGALAVCVALLAGGLYYWYKTTCCAPPPFFHQPEIAFNDTRPQQDKDALASADAARKSEGLPSQTDKSAAISNNAPHELMPPRQSESPAISARPSADQVKKTEQQQPENYTKPFADPESKPPTTASPQIADLNKTVPPDIDVTHNPPPQQQAKPSAIPIAVPIGAAPKLADSGDGGTVFRECDNCPAMVVIPAGANVIGSAANQSGHDSSEAPRREVRFRQAFAIGRDAVTYAEWDACVAEGGCNHFLPGDMGWGRGQQPVVLVSWDDAKAYTAWLSQKTGATYRLPYEAEWEYAARGCRLAVCQDQIFWFGNQISPDRANYDWRYSYAGSQKAQVLGKPRPAGTYGPNPFGLFNAVGNVAQWVEDCWNDNLKSLPADGTARQSGDCSSRVFRGGSWHDEPIDLRSASRKSDLSSSRQPYIGFRVARVLD